jgi:protein PsiE
MKSERFNQWHLFLKSWFDDIGSLLIEAFHYLALFVIGASVIWSAVFAFSDMLFQGRATIGDILLLFIYLELGEMVGAYFKTSTMPVRSLIYIAITALARQLIADIQMHHQVDVNTLLLAIAILLLAISTQVIRIPPTQNG